MDQKTQTDHERAVAGDAKRKTLEEQIEEMFTYHSPTGDQPTRYSVIRQEAAALARVIVKNTPAGADQTAAIRKLREAVMTANAAIALEGKL